MECVAELVNERYLNEEEEKVEEVGPLSGRERAIEIIAKQIVNTRTVDVQVKAEDIASDLVDAIIDAVISKITSD